MAHLEEALKLDPESGRVWLMLGYFKLLHHKTAEALKGFLRSIPLLKYDLHHQALSHYLLARVYGAQSDVASSQWHCDQALFLSPSDALRFALKRVKRRIWNFGTCPLEPERLKVAMQFADFFYYD